MRRAWLMLAAVACFGATGCATLVSDNTTFTQMDSLPSAAECVLEGENYKQVVKTPTHLTLPASAAPLTITCNINGYHMATEVVDTEIDGWIFGNLLFGGVIGIIIDAANDSGEKYPENIVLTLYRKEFESEEELNAWYDLKEKELNEQINAQIAGAAGKEDKIKKLEKTRVERMKQVKKYRSESIVVSHELT